MPKYELQRSSCEMEGVDSRGILAFIQRLKERDINLHTFTMARHGNIIAEINAFPYENTYRHVENSVTKTFTSVAIGILYDRGLLELDEPVHRYFSNPACKKNGMETLTVRHLLTMTLGQDGPDMFAAGDDSRDWCEGMFDRHVTDGTGTRFFYNSMASHLLSGIVTKITGVSECEFLKENFFDPCGIEEYDWLEDPAGNSIGGVGIYMKGTDLIKLGQLLLNKGVLNGRRILSKEWCEMASSKQVETAPWYPAFKTESTQGYGFQMWRCTHNGFRASGLFGQMCVVLPDQDVTFAVNSSTAGSQPLLDTFFETVYPCIGDMPLKENPENAMRIRELSHILDIRPLSGNAKPAYEEYINGKKIRYRDEDKYIRLTFHQSSCRFEIGETGHRYSCVLGNQMFRQEVTDFERYLTRYGSYMQSAKPRPQEHAPVTVGSYAWLGASHLRIQILFKDHTSHNYWDIYFDDYMARVDETFRYLMEGYDYHSQSILLMP